jgi:outer membrane protein
MPPTKPRWEGAIGLLAAQRPEYAGADRRVLKFTPGFFLRYGRLTVTNVSGFRTRSEGEVARGASLDLLSNPRMRLSLALRLDRGRDEGSAAAFRGLGDVRTTVRLHANLQWRLGGPLSLGANWNLDALGKGGGHGGSVGLGWDMPLDPRSAIHWYGGVSLAGDRYMQSYFGVTPEQAAVSGYPVYQPRAGLRAAEVNISYRTDLAPDWLLIASVSASHLLGPAAASPLTRKLDGWEVRSGVAWRY